VVSEVVSAARASARARGDGGRGGWDGLEGWGGEAEVVSAGEDGVCW
jgi:hypothetical protein